MISFTYLQLISLTLAGLFQPTACSPMFFQQDQQQQEEQKSMGMPQYPPQQQLMAPIITKQDNEEDTYIVLSDDEVLQNADMLRHLSLATKEEVEEIVEGNPAIQQALLSKIKKVIKLREEANHLMENGKALKNHHKHIHYQHEPIVIDKVKQVQIENVKEDKDDYNEDLEDFDELEQQLAAERIRLIKMKLKSNTAKLFKIGSSIRKKIKEMRKNKAELKEKIPKFRVNVSTSKYKESAGGATLEE